MNMRALLLCGFLAGCTGVAPIQAAEIDPDDYAAADLVAIQKEADDLDIDQLAERMDAMRDGVWQGRTPTPPANAPVSIELFVSSSFARFESSTLLWRDAAGGWQWHRAIHDGQSPDANAAGAAAGVASDAQARDLDRMLADGKRRAEIWYSPASTPLKDKTGQNACFDGASYLMVIHRASQPDEFIVQSCATRWLNGDLINAIGRIGRD